MGNDCHDAFEQPFVLEHARGELVAVRPSAERRRLKQMPPDAEGVDAPFERNVCKVSDPISLMTFLGERIN